MEGSTRLDIVLDVTEQVLRHLSTRFIDFRVGIINAVYQVATDQCADGSICHSCAWIARNDINILVARIKTVKRQCIDGLADLTRPAIAQLTDDGKFSPG